MIRTTRYPLLRAALAALLTAALAVACTARIDIRTDSAEERLVIYGRITSDPFRHEIALTRSAPYFADTPPVGVSGAEVTLSSDEGMIRLQEDRSHPGKYYTPSTFAGKEGLTYTLQVRLDFDSDGQEELFEASSYMPYTAPLDSITLQPSKLFNDMIEMQLYGRRPPNEINYLSFHGYRNGVILNDSLSGFVIIDDKYSMQEEFHGLTCFMFNQEEEERRLEPGDVVTLRIDVFTEEYAHFIWNAQSEIGNNVPIFSGPPANVESNIRALTNPSDILVSGFFTAFSGREASTVFTGEQ